LHCQRCAGPDEAHRHEFIAAVEPGSGLRACVEGSLSPALQAACHGLRGAFARLALTLFQRLQLDGHGHGTPGSGAPVNVGLAE
jgi:hypothetical protein